MVFLPYFAYYVTDSFQLGRMARSKFVESFDLAQNGDNSIDENGQHFDGEGIQSPGYGITPIQTCIRSSLKVPLQTVLLRQFYNF